MKMQKKIFIVSIILLIFFLSFFIFQCENSGGLVNNVTTSTNDPNLATLEIISGPGENQDLKIKNITFTWKYSIYSSENPEVTYFTMLEPIDSSFISGGMNVQRSFTELLPLTYTFKVKAVDKTNSIIKTCERKFSVLSEVTDPNILILIADEDTKKLSTYFNRYLDDLYSMSKTVKVDAINGGTYVDLKNHILKYSSSLEGVFMIGKLPIPWFERIDEDYGYELFPIDLYYMDLDGEWLDNDNNDIFDGYSGSYGPDIWVTRLDNTPFSTYEKYFEKVYKYRRGELKITAPGVDEKSMVFVNKDWTYDGASYYTGLLSPIYGQTNVTCYLWPTTSGSLYLSQITSGYEFVHNMCHASPEAMYFDDSSGTSYMEVTYTSIISANPKVHFNNCFNCSGCRYSEDDAICLGYIYLASDNGLASVGSTKTGSMLEFEQFYDPLSTGSTFGEAFLQWFKKNFNKTSMVNPEAWFFGMTCLGDPTLKPTVKAVKSITSQLKSSNLDYNKLRKKMIEQYKKVWRNTAYDKQRYENKYLSKEKFKVRNLF